MEFCSWKQLDSTAEMTAVSILTSLILVMPFACKVKSLPSPWFPREMYTCITCICCCLCCVTTRKRVCLHRCLFCVPTGMCRYYVPVLYTLFLAFSSESPSTIITRLHNANVCFQAEQLRAAQSRAAVYTNRSGSARMSGKQRSRAGQELCQAAGSLPLGVSGKLTRRGASGQGAGGKAGLFCPSPQGSCKEAGS